MSNERHQAGFECCGLRINKDSFSLERFSISQGVIICLAVLFVLVLLSWTGVLDGKLVVGALFSLLDLPLRFLGVDH